MRNPFGYVAIAEGDYGVVKVWGRGRTSEKALEHGRETLVQRHRTSASPTDDELQIEEVTEKEYLASEETPDWLAIRLGVRILSRTADRIELRGGPTEAADDTIRARGADSALRAVGLRLVDFKEDRLEHSPGGECVFTLVRAPRE